MNQKENFSAPNGSIPILETLTLSENFSEKWIHISFLLILSPIVWALSKYITPSELVILSTFSLVMCAYFHVLFHQKMACVHNVQIQVLSSIRDMLWKKLNTTKVIYLAENDLSDDEMEEEKDIQKKANGSLKLNS